MIPSPRPAFRKARSAWSRSSREWAAEIWQRTRAVPWGTTGYPKPVTNTPSASRASLIRMAWAVSPTMTGMIGVSPGSGLNPSSVSPSRKYLVFSRSRVTRSGWASSRRTAASALPATVQGRALLNSWGRPRWVRESQSASEPAPKPPAAPPRALPSGLAITSTSPRTPTCPAGPRPRPGQPRRAGLGQAYRGQRAAGDGAGEGVAEPRGTSPLGQVIADRFRAGHKAPRRAAQSLAQRAGDHVHLAQHAEMLGGAPPGGAQHSGGVAVVEHQHRPVLPADFEETGEIGDGPFQDRKSSRLNSSHLVISYA